MSKKTQWAIIFILIPILTALTQIQYEEINLKKNVSQGPIFYTSSIWAKQVFDTLTLEEKIGQLFVYQVYPNSQESIKKAKEYLKNYHLGGIIFFKGEAKQIAYLSRQFQALSPHIPLILSIDAEWGVNMRVKDAIKFPYAMTLGAIKDNNLIYEMGKEVAHQLHLLGLNTNFVPVIDININSENPVIGVRSFGQDKQNVAAKSFAYMKGLQDKGILTFAKHFPGHGDTDKDSHKTLPIINHSFKRLWNVELYPYRQLIPMGLSGVMIAHLYVPSIDDTPNIPSTLSHKLVGSLLRDSLHFKGLVITDAMTMQGVLKYYSTGEAEIRALLAGNDLLLMPANLPKAYNAIKQAVIRGEIPISVIDSAVMRILLAKQWLRLYKPSNVNVNDVLDSINSDYARYLALKLYENAITLVKNTDSIIPITKLENKTIAAISFGQKLNNTFHNFLQRYAKVDLYSLSLNANYEQYRQLRSRLSKYDIVIVSVFAKNSFLPPFYGVNENVFWFVARLANETQIVLNIFGPPYLLDNFKNLSNVKSIIVSYETSKYAQQASAELIFGGIPALGRLPVSVGGFSSGTGLKTKHIRLKYSSPLELGINPESLKIIDSIIYSAIDSHVFPGAQVLAIKDTVVFFYKSYGTYTYEKKQKVDEQTLYDIASLTKTTATTLALMHLYEQGKFDINKTLKDYLPELDTTDKANLRIIDILTHQARLKSWIPFYLHTYIKGTKQLNPKLYSTEKDSIYSLQLADSLFIINTIKDTILKEIALSKLRHRKKYLYSDLGFILFGFIIQSLTNMRLEDYVTNVFYKPLGAWHTRFNPLQFFDKEQIAPTENDTFFRKQQIQGYVHDYAAAMLGGVSGHAGLFSTANDLAIIYQMLLQNGYYADRKYLKLSTIKLFTTKPFPKSNRRALGFDSVNDKYKAKYMPYVSDESYGHTGFTGCMVWVDPKYNFIFIFLSNRIYPDINNHNIYHFQVRRKVQQAFYQAIFDKKNKKIKITR